MGLLIQKEGELQCAVYHKSECNLCDDMIQDNVHDQAQHGPMKSVLEEMLSVHTQVTRTLHEIDTLVLSFHELGSSNHLVIDELQDFADALASIHEILQDWKDFLKTKRSPLMQISCLEQEPCSTESLESTPIIGGKRTDLSSQSDDLQHGAISYSPLVATDLLKCENSCGSEPLVRTPLNGAGCAGSTTSSTPLPQMLCPPRYSISESPLLSTPARFLDFNMSDGNQEPKPKDLLALDRSTCQTHELVLEEHHGQLNYLNFPHTPKFGASPPRTCRPLRSGETLPIESDPSPVMPSPFRTPGILFKCKSEVSDSSSAGSPGIIDDLTASVVKRLGPKGLEERLWQELATRKADILQPDKQRKCRIGHLD